MKILVDTLPRFEIGDVVDTGLGEPFVVKGLRVSNVGEWWYWLVTPHEGEWFEEPDLTLYTGDAPDWIVPAPQHGYLWTNTPQMGGRSLGLPHLPISEENWRNLVKKLGEWVIETFGPQGEGA